MEASISFECRDCRKPATVIEGNGVLACAYCPACGNAVDAGAAADMHDTLLGRYRRERGIRVSGRRLSDRLADRRWPFVLVVVEQRRIR